MRDQGVSAFKLDNTTGAVINNFVRSIAIDQRGLWIGYFAATTNEVGGIGHYDKKSWANCNQLEEMKNIRVNALRIDSTGRIWAGTEQSGIAMFDGKVWRVYTIKEGLPNNGIFGLTIDKQDNIWAATWEGVAKFNGETWSVPYSVGNQTIFNNHVHAIEFDSAGNTWVGHVEHGVSQYRNTDGKWLYYRKENSAIGGDQIRSIAIRKADTNTPESVWFATADGGVSKFVEGQWTTYRVEDGLPSNTVREVVVDKYNRVWAATAGGVAYLEGTNWIIYDTLNTYSIAFGITCQECPFDDDHVWTGTATSGVTHSRLPHLDNKNVVQIQQVCFNAVDTKKRSCQPIQEVQDNLVITATYPRPLAPGEQFRPEIVISPRAAYQLRESFGDFLANTDYNLFGVYQQMAVKGTVDAGQPFTFTDYDNLFTAPELPEGAQERTFVSTWRVWMRTRYVGRYVRIVFTVQKKSAATND